MSAKCFLQGFVCGLTGDIPKLPSDNKQVVSNQSKLVCFGAFLFLPVVDFLHVDVKRQAVGTFVLSQLNNSECFEIMM